MLKPITTPELFCTHDIRKIERRMNLRYICEAPIRNKMGEWWNHLTAIFYSDEAHPDGSNYAAVYFNPSFSLTEFFISDGISATEGYLYGKETDEGVLYSRYRHDCRSVSNKDGSETMVDGGRDYFKSRGPGGVVRLAISGDRLRVVDQD